MLELTSLKKAITSLEKSIKVAKSKEIDKTADIDEVETIKAGVIQNFEFTYELCWKHMKRWLEMNISPGLMEGVTRKQLFRYAAENFLIKDFDAWMLYHELRNKTAHTYDSEVANEIFNNTGMFLKDAEEFLKALEVRND